MESSGYEELDEVASSGSLRSRMQSTQAAVAERHTELFPVPNWEDMVEVELRVLGWKTMRRIADRHRKIREPALQELYTATDQIITATEGFHEIDGEKRTRVDMDWIGLARAGEGNRGVKSLPEGVTPRQAVLALVVHDTRLMYLWQEWQDWLKSVRPEVDEEVVRDFSTTG